MLLKFGTLIIKHEADFESDKNCDNNLRLILVF